MPVYQYDGQHYELPDGLTNDQAIAKIEAYLGKTPAAAPAEPAQPSISQTIQQGLSGLDRTLGLTARGAVQGALSPVVIGTEAAQAAEKINPASFMISPGISGLTRAAEALASKGVAQKPAGQVVSEALTNVGLPQAETLTEKAALSGVEALAGGARSVGKSAAENLRTLAALATGGAVAPPVAQEVTTRTGSELLGTLAGAGAAMVAGGATGKGINAVARAWDEKLPTIQEVKQRAQQNYSVLDQSGVTVKPKSVLDMVNGMETSLKEANYIPKTDTKIGNALEMFREIVGTERVPFNKIEKLRSIATNLSKDSDANTRRLAGVMVNDIDSYINSLSGKDIIAGADGLDKSVKAVMAARQDWRNASKAQVIQDALDIADIRGLNPKKSESELIRTNLENILANKNKRALFTDAEVNEMKSVINGGPVDVLASFIGRFNPLRPFGAAGSGGVAMGTGDAAMGAAVAGAGLLTDTAQGMLKRRAMDRLIRGLAAGTIKEPTNYKYQGLMGGVLGQQ